MKNISSRHGTTFLSVAALIIFLLSLMFLRESSFCFGPEILKKSLFLHDKLRNGCGNIASEFPTNTSETSVLSLWELDEKNVFHGFRYDYKNTPRIDQLKSWERNDKDITSISVISVDNKSGEERLLFSIPPLRALHHCSWSNFKKTFACFQAFNSIVLLHSDVQNPVIISNKDWRVENRLAWVSDNELAFLVVDESKQQYSILRMNVATQEIKEVCETNVMNKFLDGVKDPKYPLNSISCHEKPEFSALFGSSEWPVMNLLPAGGAGKDRYYFYKRWRPSTYAYPGKEWIEGYDKQTDKTFHVFTEESMLKSIFGDSFILRLFSNTPF